MKVKLTRNENDLLQYFSLLKTPRDVADFLEIPLGALLWILYSSHYSKKRYEEFEIPKKSGGVRKISSPRNSIKILQEKILPFLKNYLGEKGYLHGFIKGKSIVTNARVHSKRKYVLNIDIKNFYESINFGRVRALLMYLCGMGEKAATIIAQIVCWKKCLPQGACTSPILSNLIGYRLDKDLIRLCRENNARYTRYADDITISWNDRRRSSSFFDFDNSCELHENIYKIFKKNGFEINREKVRCRGPHQRREVTGLTVNEYPNVRRRFIDEIRILIACWRNHGLEKAALIFSEKKKFSIENLEKTKGKFLKVLYGKISFLHMVKGITDPVL